VLSPDFGIGDTLAVFQSCGKTQWEIEMLNSSVTIGAMLRAVCLSMKADMSS